MAPDRSLEIEVEDLMAAVRDNREPLASGVDGLEELVLAHSIYRSSAEGVSVRI
jgi:predicted dehydrogenase